MEESKVEVREEDAQGGELEDRGSESGLLAVGHLLSSDGESNDKEK